jgi:glycerophosphoryl diester phosphodiesterase
MGANKLAPYAPPGKPQPEYRENTLASLREAARLGARFVEFDVQVTADNVPVLWHDDWVLTKKDGGEGHNSHKVAEVQHVLPVLYPQ